MIFNIGGVENVKGKLPEFTYTGAFELNDEGKDGTTQNWQLKLLTSGKLTFAKVVDEVDLFVLGAGGAGANTGGTAPGGGGYYKTVAGVAVEKKAEYSIIIGAAGDAANEAGGQSSAFGTTANGGGAAKAGKQIAVTCTCKCSQGGSSVIRYATSTDVSGWSYLSSSEASIKLAYPIEYVDVTVSGQNATCIRGYDGKYYYVNILSENTKHYANGTTGTGAASTKVFGSGDTVSGTGGTSAASRRGQGGGSSAIAGGNGLVVLRNAR